MAEQKERDHVSSQLDDYYKLHEDLGSATSSSGNPVPYKDSSVTVGKDGNIVLEDWHLLDELTHFSRERIPERVVHAKGAGAFGYFEVTHDITQYTVARVFETIGKKTNIAVRFSTVAGNLGSADTVRDPRGFAVKFYTEDGIWDLVGNNTPIFFIRDPIMFPQFIHSQKRNPVTHTRDWDAFWDFISLRPETTHQVMILFSDRGIPDGFRHMHGYGSHTFALINKDKVKTYCKFHYKTDQIMNLPVDEANRLAGVDPDYSVKDLYNAIACNELPSWKMSIQTMSEQQAKQCPFNPFDLTKVWPQEDYPLKPVGKFTLNRNPTNYFAEIEQIAFAPSSLIPGIAPSKDRMLLGRLFSYNDAHVYRLGANYQQLPVNCPFRVRNFQRDGQAALNNQGGAPNYHPNSFGGPNTLKNQRAWAYRPTSYVEGTIDWYDTKDEDNYSQASVLYRKVFDEPQRTRFVANVVDALQNANEGIQKRTVDSFSNVDKDLGKRLAKGLKQKTVATV